MPRKGSVPKRDVLADPMYNSKLVTRFINKLMLDGKRGKAQAIFYSALDIIKEKAGREPIEVFEEAIKNVAPVLEVKPRRVGGATYQVPLEVSPDRKMILAIRWLVSYSRSRGEKTMAQRLAAELMDAANSMGSAFKKKEDTHKMAEANKAFAHYRW
ncbi:MAG: 30S ribosomal protein S7 [Candidatus Contubernalis sp.]|nr:30S ribosomal protein S7 [Candidatus Contubernalis sp.]